MSNAATTLTTNWQLTFEGEVYTLADVSAGAARDLSELLGAGWFSTDPTQSPAHLLAVLTVLHSERKRINRPDLGRRLRAMPVLELLETLGAAADAADGTVATERHDDVASVLPPPPPPDPRG